MKRNILVLSTDEQLLQFINANLSGENLTVGVLQDASSLPNALYSTTPDLLIVDFFLNDVNGGAICHQLKSDPITHNLPIILLADEPEIARFGSKFGCSAMLSKSTQLGELRYTIDVLLADAVPVS